VDVLQVVPYYSPAWCFGGPPRVMWEEALQLVDQGHEVSAFTTDAAEDGERQPGPEVSVEQGVSVHRFRNRLPGLAYSRYRFTPRGFRAALRSSRPDVVHLSESRHELAAMTWGWAHRAGVPLAFSAHGTLPRRSGPKAAARALYDRLLLEPMVRGAAVCLAQTDHEAELYAAAGAPTERIALLPLGTSAPPPAGERIDLGPPDDARVVLFLGRIHELKGVHRLVRGFAAVASLHDDAHLVVAGRDDGALASTMALADELGLGKRVHFPGPIYGDRRFDAYRRATLFAITPTHFEETSLASLEAASVGTPLLVSAEADVPGLGAAGAGICIAAGEDPAEALDAALNGGLPTAGHAARRLIERQHLWPAVGKRLAELLAEAIA
jgi:glycosyltransferase involved in cell wall biosynthesis